MTALTSWAWWAVVGALVIVAGWWFLDHRARQRRLLVVAVGLVFTAVATVGLLRAAQVRHNPVAALAGRHASVEATATVTGDPMLRTGQFGDYVLVPATVTGVRVGDQTLSVRAPVLIVADRDWHDVELGGSVRTRARLAPAEDGLSALLVDAARPETVTPPDVWWQVAARIRAAIRAAVAHRPPSQAALVPALVDGDDSEVSPVLKADFATSGLTHLLAVSGTNLTLIVGFVLAVARWCGVRGRWLTWVGAAGIVGFVILARTEPSVLRAAMMGTVGLCALGRNGRDQGPRALGVAIVALLLIDPALAGSAGFALSCLATAGIVFLAPGWRDSMGRWLPAWFAEALAVPAAAQLACTPVVAALSGQVSLVAVVANLIVAPVVGPATVAGLCGGLIGLGWPLAGRLCGTVAGWCVGWIVAVARHCAALPTSQIAWGTGAVAIAVLVIACLALAAIGHRILRRRTLTLLCVVVVGGIVLVPLRNPWWPPDQWVMAMCDVGQGQALVLNAGQGNAIVVDAGPDPDLVDGCLDRLGIEQVPLVVLTHFHADHVAGIAGVGRGRAVGEIVVGPLAEPPEGVAQVQSVAARLRRTPALAQLGETRSIGQATIQFLGPVSVPDTDQVRPAGDGSGPNNASIVIVAEVRGVTMLLSADVEPEAQGAVAQLVPGLRVDVLTVPHHGSRYQDLGFLTGLGARIALVSVGADNDYGHPAAEVLTVLERSGARVWRTDLAGDLIVVAGPDGEAGVQTR